MKRVLVLAIIVLAVLAIPLSTFDSPMPIRDVTNPQQGPSDSISVSSASNSGNDISSLLQYTREIQGLDFALMNSFGDTSSHLETLDFSAYHIAGWALYEVQVSPSRIIAQSEHEVVGTSSSPSSVGFRIYEHDLDLYYDQLAQGFYNMNHDGKLENASILYDSPTYDPSNQNYAYFDIRSDYQDGSTNLVSSVQLDNVGLSATWKTVTESAILDADTTYYAVMNGSTLVEYSSIYPVIRWFYEDTAGSYLTRRHNTDGDSWGSDRPFEAILNYTYIPWNTTSNSALEFQNPLSIALQGNSSALSGSDWLFNSTSNVSQVQFSSNQSISVEYDLTLRYRQTISSKSTWFAGTSGTDVTWNLTSVVDFPELSGSQDKNLTLVLPNDWTANHLFNLTNPTQYYDHFSQEGSSVECTLLADETWVLECTSPNYLQSLATFDTSDDSTITEKVSVSVTMDVNATIESPTSNPATSGVASLRVFYQNSQEYAENYTVTAGKSYHQWDISTHSSSNGLHTIDLSWMNGTEAGYLTSDILVYYETTFVADEYSIDAFTEDTFYIGVDFDQIFPVGGIDAAAADVTYSFGAVVNQSLDDQSNGRWDATVSTASMTPATYDLHIYAEGYALENKSLTIQVTLIHDTETLTILWSNTNDITYIESTELSVAYNRVGSIPITDATVNVTIDTTTWILVWDGPSQTYKVTFDGSDVPPGYGVHSLTIEAWKDGHEAQLDSTQTLTLSEEPTTLVITWSNTNSITYVESTTLIANYTMSDGSPVLSALVNVTIGSDTWMMTWNGVTETYEYVFDGDATLPGFGVHSVAVEAGKLGYVYKSNSSLSLTISEEPTTLVLTWSPDFDITYIEETYLIANYTMSDGSAVLGATVNVTINSNLFILNWYAPTQTYRVLIKGSDNPPGLGVFPITVRADLYGYVSKTDNTKNLIINEDPTTLILLWSDGSSITYIEQTTLSASFIMSNGSAVRNAVVNVTTGGTTWQLLWHEGSQAYRKTFLGTDDPPGFGLHSLTVEADKFGFVDRVDSSETLTLSEEPTTLVLTFSNDFTITYIEETYLIANYTMSDGSAVLGATVNVTIISDVWTLNWHIPTQTYRVLFKGSDDPPGIDSHSLSVQADLFGYESKTDNTKNLIINEDPTTLILLWSDGTSITYIEQTTLSAFYTMSNTSVIRGALVNVTIGGDTWLLTWHEGSQSYRKTFLGTDVPPGFGVHSLSVEADLFGFVSRSDSSEQLTISEEPTTMTVGWSNGSSITYVTQTTLTVSYRMSDATPITVATVTATIGVDVWGLTWNPVSEAYEVTFRGDDNPPGIGVHSLTIDASKTGFVSQSNNTESLTIAVEPTTLQLTWWLSDTITYVEQTVLYANFSMSDGSPIVGAYVTVVIGSSNKTFEWNAISEVYSLILSGNDPAYELGAHPVSVQATLFGFEQQNDNTQTLTVLEEPTTVTPTWNPDNNITYFESTKLSVRYEMGNGDPITGALVNVTIGTDVWVLVWNPVSEAYEYTFSGMDNPPGYGTHSIEVKASKYGYESIIDSSQQLTIRLEDTIISFQWDPSDTITYVEQTKIRIFYQMANTTPVLGAAVNITRGPMTWVAVWNDTSQAYEYTWLGDNDPPGFGSHLLQIKAGKTNYVGIIDISQTLTINREPTQILASWSNGNNITYVQSTKLLVSFITSGGVVIPDAYVDVTIGTDNWQLSWNATSQLYEKIFSGSDNPPSLGFHSLSIRSSEFGYETSINGSVTLTLRVEPTTLTPSWSPGNSITYVGSTTLSVRYEMSNEDPIPGANVNVTIGTDVWVLSWNAVSEAYEYTFSGSDDPPGLGIHSLIIQASNWGFQNAIDSLESLTITEEPTSFVISWSNTDNITYVRETTLSVRYQMSDTTPITGAVLNVTINGNLWLLTWNATSEAYEVTIRGDDNPPGYGTHIVEIRASKFGFVPIIDTTQEFTIRLEDTNISYVWDLSDTITYTGQTKIRISYLMSNDTPIVGATVNVTIGTTWTAIWNDTTKAYEYTWLGTHSPPGLGSHVVTVQAWKVNYVAVLDTSQTLTINEEPTQIQASWSNGNSISFTESTKLLVNFTSSIGTVIPLATVNVTIGIDLWPLLWNSTSQLYEIIFSNASVTWPGLGTHGLTIMAKQFGYENTIDITQTLTINSENVKLSSELLGGSTITYIESTVLVVNYTTIAGVPIVGATVNVTIGGTLWNLTWDSGSETYRIRFNGSDNPPGFGTHNLRVNASSFGFEAYPDSSQFLTIIEEPTSLDIYWGAPNFNNVTYYGYTILYAEYKMSNGTVIQGANVNVTIASTTWTLEWNSTQGAYSLRFNGSDSLP
ncbi:MAG: hypothetical protein RTU30_12740, partial [Candidatus Thorarchaeota archaeon]